MTLDCNIPTARGFQVVTDERTPVLVEKYPKNVKVLRCHVGHATIFHHPLPSAVLLRKLTIRDCLQSIEDEPFVDRNFLLLFLHTLLSNSLQEKIT